MPLWIAITDPKLQDLKVGDIYDGREVLEVKWEIPFSARYSNRTLDLLSKDPVFLAQKAELIKSGIFSEADYSTHSEEKKLHIRLGKRLSLKNCNDN